MARQPNASMMVPATSGVTATANRLKKWVVPWMRPRSDRGNQSCMPRLATGNAPASPRPRKKRAANREVRPRAAPVATAATDHHDMIAVSTRFGPKRSPNQPAGTWPRAYAHVKALRTSAMLVLLSPNALAISGCATEMLLRSM
jgi:hypothetical protein